MANNSDIREPTKQDKAFERVLDAESAADAALKSGRADAQRLRLEANAQDRRISDRADRRLSKLHARVQEMIASEIETMDTAFEAERADLATPTSLTVITAAARRLARRMVDAPSDSSD